MLGDGTGKCSEGISPLAHPISPTPVNFPRIALRNVSVVGKCPRFDATFSEQDVSLRIPWHCTDNTGSESRGVSATYHRRVRALGAFYMAA